MSIVNVWVEDRQALVGVDTEGQGLDGQRRQGLSKVLALPAAGAVCAGRGNLLYLNAVFGACLASGFDFDELGDHLVEIAADVFERVLPLLSAAGATDPEVQELVLVGWSARAQRMQGWEVTQATHARGFARSAIRPHFIAPWHASMEPLPDPRDWDSMARAARVQARFLRAHGYAGGGRLVVAMVRPDSIHIERLGALHEEPAAACTIAAHG
jgi:hypothetical protein